MARNIKTLMSKIIGGVCYTKTVVSWHFVPLLFHLQTFPYYSDALAARHPITNPSSCPSSSSEQERLKQLASQQYRDFREKHHNRSVVMQDAV